MDLDDARAILAQQPFSALLGARLDELAEGHAVLTVPLRDDLRNHGGTVHGGVLAYLADNAVAFAGGTVIGTGVATADLSLDFVRPAAGDVVATATVVAHTARAATCRCELTVDDVVVAVAQGTVRLRGGAGTSGQGAGTPTGLG